MGRQKVTHEFAGKIYHYIIRTLTMEETFDRLRKTKEEYMEKGFTEFSVWFNCGEDDSYICLHCKKYGDDESN